jgi:hypothetical protein
MNGEGQKFDPAMTFIDGVGVGGPVVDRLIQMGYGSRITEVGGSQKPHKQTHGISQAV